MSEPVPDLHGPHGPGAASPLQPQGAQPPALDPLEEGSFAQLLDQLRSQAEALEARAGATEEGAELKDSVQRAGDSFRDAMEIGERLIEAYRRENL